MSRCANCNGEYDWSDLKCESFQCLGGRYVSICPECLRQLRNEERSFIERKEREKREQEQERKREERIKVLLQVQGHRLKRLAIDNL